MRGIKVISTTNNTNDYTYFDDCYTNITGLDMLLMKVRCRRNSALTILVSFIEKYSNEIETEKGKANPDSRYIAVREKKIQEMRQTISRAGR